MKLIIITAAAASLLTASLAAQTNNQKNTPQVATNTAHTDIVRKTNDPDGMIVTEVPSGENELPVGAAIWVKLQTPLYSNIAHPGERFTGTVSREVTAHGKVLLPIGTTVMGKVVYAHDGNRWLGSKAKIKLRPEDLILADGTHIPIYANIVDTDRTTNTSADDDGAITARSNGATDYVLLHPNRVTLPMGAELIMELTKPLQVGPAAPQANVK